MTLLDYSKVNYCRGCKIKYPKTEMYCNSINGCGCKLASKTRYKRKQKEILDT